MLQQRYGAIVDWRGGAFWREPICERLGLPVLSEPFPATNTTDEFRDMIGMPPLT
jgi:hypothetical protein